jgi:dynein heavy chain
LQDSKVYTFEELSDNSSSLISQRHSEMREAGREIGKLLSSSNRVLKVIGGCCRPVQAHHRWLAQQMLS